MCANRKKPHGMLIVTTEESINPRSASRRMLELNMSSPDPDQRVESVALAPGEPLPQLVGVQEVGMPELRAR